MTYSKTVVSSENFIILIGRISNLGILDIKYDSTSTNNGIKPSIIQASWAFKYSIIIKTNFSKYHIEALYAE